MYELGTRWHCVNALQQIFGVTKKEISHTMAIYVCRWAAQSLKPPNADFTRLGGGARSQALSPPPPSWFHCRG